MFERLGKLVYRRRKQTLILAGLFLLASLAMLLWGGELTNSTIEGIESDEAQQRVQEVLGHPEETTVVVLFHSDSLTPTSEPFRAAMKETLAPLYKDPRVLSVLTPIEAPAPMAAVMMNEQARSAYALVTLAGDMRRALASYPGVRGEIHSNTLQVACTGQVPFTNDLSRTLEHDLVQAEMISLPVALVILLAVFGTLVAAALPVGVGGLAVAGGIAIVFLISRRWDIAQYTVNVCSLIGLGVAIDYSLFIVSRYREELANGQSYEDALVKSVATAGRVVAFSGCAVGTGLTGLLFFERSYLLPMGLGGAIVVALAVIFALTFLPALLAVLGPRIHAGKLPLPSLLSANSDKFWHRMALAVMRHPLAVLIPTLTILLVMGVPFFHLRMATADTRVLAPDVEARATYIRLQRDFPDMATNRVLIAIRFPTAPALNVQRIDAMYDFSRRIAKIPGVRKVQSLVDYDESIGKDTYEQVLIEPPEEVKPIIDAAKKQLASDRIVLMNALSDLPPDSEAARDMVREIRKDRRIGDGTFVVGGQTAQDLDTTEYILKRAPRAVGFVVAATIVILFLLLGSVILPLKAVIMNFVSIAGSFGAIVWIFQDGHLWVHNPLPLEPSLPVMLFCVLFGLSMDYEVLMLSRIKESYEKTGDNTHAVAEGLEKTAGLITSAALIMVAVFTAFSLARVVPLQAVGFGMAFAVALDATLVRVLLVPATMRLFGHLNWWAPSGLLRLRRAVRRKSA